MMKIPKIGDTVVIRGVARSVGVYHTRVDVPGKGNFIINTDQIDEIIPTPWVPKAGDKVRFIPYDDMRYEIIALYDHKAWFKNISNASTFIAYFNQEDYELCVD